MNNQLHHWFRISFSGNDANLGLIPFNFVINAPMQYVPEKINNKAIKELEEYGLKWLASNKPLIKPEDLIMHNINYLGHMTFEEFHAE